MRAATLVRSLKIGIISVGYRRWRILFRSPLSLITKNWMIVQSGGYMLHLNDGKAPWLGQPGFSNLDHEHKWCRWEWYTK